SRLPLKGQRRLNAGLFTVTASDFDDKIIRAADLVRAAFFVQAYECQPETCLEGENFCEKPESMYASRYNGRCNAPLSSMRSVHANPGRGSAAGRARTTRRQASF